MSADEIALADVWWRTSDTPGNVSQIGRADVTDVYYSHRVGATMVVALVVGRDGDVKPETYERERFLQAFTLLARCTDALCGHGDEHA